MPLSSFSPSNVDRLLSSEGLQVQHSHISDEMMLRKQLNGAFLRAPIGDETAIRRLQIEPDWLPVSIDVSLDRIVWARFDQDLYSGPFFFESILYWLDESHIQNSITTRASILAQTDILPDCPGPDGFIFHMARCRSTLLGRSISALPDHHVFFEGPPTLIEALFGMTNGWRCLGSHSLKRQSREVDDLIVKNIINLCRSRFPYESKCYFKMVSWNTIFSDIFHRVFPDSPGIFMYRRPVDAFRSVLENRPRSWPVQGSDKANFLSGIPAEDQSYANYHRMGFLRFFQRALEQDWLKFANYDIVNHDNVFAILNHGLKINVSDANREEVMEGFSIYSKDPHGAEEFQGDRNTIKSQWVSEWLGEVLSTPYQQLEQAQRNLRWHC